MITQSMLDKLKKAYYSGVLIVQEGDTRIEYQSMKQMRIAIQDAENEIAGRKPQGTRKVRMGKSS